MQRDPQSSGPVIDKNHCWTTLKYTKPLKFQTLSALKNSDGNTAVSIKAEEALVRRSAFPKPPPNPVKPLVSSCRLLHTKVTEEVVAQALMTQAVIKAPGPDKINF